MREQAIAQQDADRRSPFRVGGRLIPTKFRTIHDIVVNQSRDVDHFHDHREINVARRNSPGCAPSQKGENRPQPFAPFFADIGNIAFHSRIKGSRLFADSLLDRGRDAGS